MKSDSNLTKHQKTELARRVQVAFDIRLPRWFLEGATVSDMRNLIRIFDRAHERYSTEDVPTK